MDKPVQQAAASTIIQLDLARPRIDSKDLFVNGSELIILHNDEEYHLRITRNEKLILTK